MIKAIEVQQSNLIMSLTISRIKLTESGLNNNSSSINSNNRLVLKNKLAGLLFAKTIQSSKQITFGWSKNISETESKILDVLTDPKNKDILIVSHNQPDGDAHGSSIGIAGILKSLGANVHPVIDDDCCFNFRQMPSYEFDYSALDVTKKVSDFNNKNLNSINVAVITDSANPERISKEAFNLFSKAKKVVIIDHHISQNGKNDFKDQWENKLAKLGIQPANILYWAEERASASEMVAELDREVLNEALKGNLINYNPEKNKTNLQYRLATAAGIITDTSLDSPKDLNNPDLMKQSSKRVTLPDGKEVSSTVASFKWLVENSGVKPSEINFDNMIKQPIPEGLDTFLEQILYFQTDYKGIKVKNPGCFNSWGYTYIENKDVLEDIAKKYSTESEPFLASDIYRIIKNKEKEKLYYKMPNCVIILATKEPDNIFNLSIRSTDDSAIDVLKILEKAGLGKGGGHKYACGFQSKQGVDFIKDAVPIINRFLIMKNKAEQKAKKASKKNVRLDFVG